MLQPAATGPSSLEQSKKKYKKINGCSHSLPLWQIIALAVMAALQILNFNLITPTLELACVPLYFLFSLNYLCTALVAVDYIILLLCDPSDPRLADSNYRESGQILIHCKQCDANVSNKSYHCFACKRCVDDFDHHCVFLNNCIGRQNYSIFCRLLLTLICNMSLNIGIGVTLFLKLDGTSKWVALSYAVLGCVVLIEIGGLAVFHCYISFCLHKSTLEVIRGDRKQPNEASAGKAQLAAKPEYERKEMEEQIEEPTQVGLHKMESKI